MNDHTVMGVHVEGGLQVLVDVGLADVVGIKVEELKKRMQIVTDLQAQVKELKDREQHLKKEISVIHDLKEKGDKSMNEQLDKLKDDVDFLKQRYRERENDDDTEEPDEEEPGIALEDQLRITEQSAKAIDLLSSHLLSTVWQTCSKNTFGFYIRIMLLCGSQFKKQLIPETASLIILGLLTVLFSAAMQIILAYYLWTRLPQTYPEINGNNILKQPYPGTSGGRDFYNWYSPPLPAYSYPNYKFANDVCRTVPIVQLVTIGLFLFSIFNNIPGVIKNFHIIWNSDRFISVDEEGITKLHYWRESAYSRQSANNFLEFLYARFEKNLRDVNQKFGGKLVEIQTSIESGTTGPGPWKDSDLSGLGRLRVKSRIKPSAQSDASDAKQKSPSADVLLGVHVYDVEAFLCEMYLSGSIIHDSKNQKIIQEYQKNQTQNHSVAESREHVDEYKAYAGAARRRWMLDECFTAILPKKWWQRWIPTSFLSCSNLLSRCRQSPSTDVHIPKSFFEVCETRSFLAEALRLMDQANNTKKAGIAKDRDLAPEKEPLLFNILRDNTAVWPPPIELKLWPQPIQFCDQARLNLVRIDYLRPSKWTRPNVWSWLNTYERHEDDREQVRLANALNDLNHEIENLAKEKRELIKKIETSILSEAGKVDTLEKMEAVFKKLEDECKTKERGLMKAIHSIISDKKKKEERKRAKIGCSLRKCLTCKLCVPCCCPPNSSGLEGPSQDSRLTRLSALQRFLGRDFADVLTSVSFSHACSSRMIGFRFLAFTFGILPELISLLFMVVAGVQYILWSGFKVDSDTQGMEEIILATLAINFIYEIDDAVYDHVLPELYKEAHERDRFDITGYWISSETSVILDKCTGTATSWWWHKIRKWCACRHTNRTDTEIDADEEDCLKMLLKCPPIVCQDLQRPLERGFLETLEKNSDEKAMKEHDAEMTKRASDDAVKNAEEKMANVKQRDTSDSPNPLQLTSSLVFKHPGTERHESNLKVTQKSMEPGPDQTTVLSKKPMPALAAEELELLRELRTRKSEGNASFHELRHLEELENHDKPWLLLDAKAREELEGLKKMVEELNWLVEARNKLADFRQRGLHTNQLSEVDQREQERLEKMMTADRQKKLQVHDMLQKRLQDLQLLADQESQMKAEYLVSNSALFSDEHEHLLQQLTLQKFRGELTADGLATLSRLQQQLTKPWPVLSVSEREKLKELLEQNTDLTSEQNGTQKITQIPAGQLSREETLASPQGLARPAEILYMKQQEKVAKNRTSIEGKPTLKLLQELEITEKNLNDGLHWKAQYLPVTTCPSMVTWHICKPGTHSEFASQWPVMNAHERATLERLEEHLNTSLSAKERLDLQMLEQRLQTKVVELSSREKSKKLNLKIKKKIGGLQPVEEDELLERAKVDQDSEPEPGLMVDVSKNLIDNEEFLEHAKQEVLTIDEQKQMKSLLQRQRQFNMSREAFSSEDKLILKELHQLAEAGVHRKFVLLQLRRELSSEEQKLLFKSPEESLTPEDQKTLVRIKEQVKPWPVLNAWERKKLEELEGLELLDEEMEKLVQLKQRPISAVPLSIVDRNEAEWLLLKERVKASEESKETLLKELQHLADTEVHKKVEQLNLRFLLGSELSAQNQDMLQLLLRMKDSGMLLTDEEQAKLTQLQLLAKPWPVLNERERKKLQELRGRTGNKAKLLEALEALDGCDDRKMLEQLRLRQKWMSGKQQLEWLSGHESLEQLRLRLEWMEFQSQTWRLNVQEHRKLRALKQAGGAEPGAAAGSVRSLPILTDIQKKLKEQLETMRQQEEYLTVKERTRLEYLEQQKSSKSGLSGELLIELELLQSRNTSMLELGLEAYENMLGEKMEHSAERQKELDKFITNCAKTILSVETKNFECWKTKFDQTIETNKSVLSNDWNDWDVETMNSHVHGSNARRGSPFVRAMRMSVTDEWNDIYLAHAYPFLYARKLRYAFANHLWERFLIFYGMWGVHLIVLIVITIAIVGGYRTVAQCNRFAPDDSAWLGIFAKQEWPSMCLLNVGQQQYEDFAGLENATAENYLAVSCGVNGYIPEFAEWNRNRDYFGPPPSD